MAFRPTPDNTWWQAWLSQIAGNNTIPDQYAFHIEGTLDDPNNDLEYTNASLAAALTTYGLPDRQININEYGNPFEQVPAGAAWWISRLERYDAIGLRGNWAGGTTLHDLFANAITKIADPFNYAATDVRSSSISHMSPRDCMLTRSIGYSTLLPPNTTFTSTTTQR